MIFLPIFVHHRKWSSSCLICVWWTPVFGYVLFKKKNTQHLEWKINCLIAYRIHKSCSWELQKFSFHLLVLFLVFGHISPVKGTANYYSPLKLKRMGHVPGITILNFSPTRNWTYRSDFSRAAKKQSSTISCKI